MNEEELPYLGGKQQKLFHEVLVLTDKNDFSWPQLFEKIPTLPRGWYELARLCIEDRIEFTRAYWMAKLPFISTKNIQELDNFFDDLEAIEIYATQLRPSSAFEVHMIYALQNDSGYFQGGPPATEQELNTFRQQFAHLNFPPDYLAFLQIHNGFSKYTDTGLVKIQEMPRIYRHFQELLEAQELVRPDGHIIEPKSLIPFYESFGLHCYQCFYTDWYIGNEMGNVYFSEHDRTISNFLNEDRLDENLAFTTFLDWLVFYLEDIWHL